MDRANLYAEKKENRMMMTGLHTVADIYFVKCGSYVGWRYVRRKHSMLLFLFLAFAFAYLNVFWHQPFVCKSGVWFWEEPTVQGRKIYSWKVSNWLIPIHGFILFCFNKVFFELRCECVSYSWHVQDLVPRWEQLANDICL